MTPVTPTIPASPGTPASHVTPEAPMAPVVTTPSMILLSLTPVTPGAPATLRALTAPVTPATPMAPMTPAIKLQEKHTASRMCLVRQAPLFGHPENMSPVTPRGLTQKKKGVPGRIWRCLSEYICLDCPARGLIIKWYQKQPMDDLPSSPGPDHVPSWMMGFKSITPTA